MLTGSELVPGLRKQRDDQLLPMLSGLRNWPFLSTERVTPNLYKIERILHA